MSNGDGGLSPIEFHRLQRLTVDEPVKRVSEPTVAPPERKRIDLTAPPPMPRITPREQPGRLDGLIPLVDPYERPGYQPIFPATSPIDPSIGPSAKEGFLPWLRELAIEPAAKELTRYPEISQMQAEEIEQIRTDAHET